MHYLREKKKERMTHAGTVFQSGTKPVSIETMGGDVGDASFGTEVA